MKHGIPMTNHILRLNILTLITKHNRDDQSTSLEKLWMMILLPRMKMMMPKN